MLKSVFSPNTHWPRFARARLTIVAQRAQPALKRLPTTQRARSRAAAAAAAVAGTNTLGSHTLAARLTAQCYLSVGGAGVDCEGKFGVDFPLRCALLTAKASAARAAARALQGENAG